MDKKQKTLVFSILVVLLLMVFLAGFTFAKYYTNYQGAGSLQVAKWSFKVNGWSTSETNEISLLDTVDHEGKVNLENGKMAPGFSGKAELELDATESEVDVEYHIEATESGNKPSNLFFQAKIDGVSTVSYTTLAELAEKELTGRILKSDKNQKRTIEIFAIWPYETGNTETDILENDKKDTQDGENNLQNYMFALKVVGTQAKATT